MERSGDPQDRRRAPHGQASLGIILIDTGDFTIHGMNGRFPRILNSSAAELRGRDFTSFFPDDEERERFSAWIRHDPESTMLRVRITDGNGAIFPVALTWKGIDAATAACAVETVDRVPPAADTAGPECVHYLDNLPVGILILREQEVLYANPALSDFLKCPPGVIRGQNLPAFLDDQDRQSFEECVHRRADGDGGPGEFRFIAKDGSRRVAQVSACPVLWSRTPSTLVTFTDLSEKQALEERIRSDNERRRGIIVTVAHELRTPLQPILGYLNLLIQDPDGFGIGPDARRILERCLVSVDRERQIINQMLELSVLDSGKLHLNHSRFPLRPLIENVLDAGGYPARAGLTLEIPPDLDIAGDRERLFGVFNSLFSNAVNFSHPPRTIIIRYRSAPGDQFHRISVTDNGVGIAENALSSIFEPFQLADAATLSRRYDRIGLSLSVARKILQMHGGDITVESTLHAGSTFTLLIPKET